MAPGHNEKWVEDAKPTPLIVIPWWEFHIKKNIVDMGKAIKEELNDEGNKNSR